MTRLRKRLAGVGAIAFLALGALTPGWAQSSLQEAATEFIVADVVRLREAPSSSARVLAHLRISTPVFIIEEDDAGDVYDGWQKIAPRANPALQGYVSAGLVSARRPSAPDLQEDLNQTLRAGDFDGALVAAERLHALSPEDRLVTLDLIEILRARGETGRAEMALAVLMGKDLKHIVYCRNADWTAFEGPYMLAQHEPMTARTASGAAERPRLPAGAEAGWLLSSSPRPATDVIELQKSAWYMDGDDLLSRRDLTAWTLSPGLRYDARMEPRATPPLSADARAACPRPGLLRSNEPFVEVPLRTVRSEPLMEALSETPRIGPLVSQAARVRAARVPYADRYTSISVAFERRATCANCPAAPEEIVFHALYDQETQQVLAQRGAIYAVGRDTPTIIHVTAMRWGRWSSTGETFALIEWENTTDGPGGGAFVDWMVFDAEGYIDGGTFTIEAWRGLRREEG